MIVPRPFIKHEIFTSSCKLSLSLDLRGLLRLLNSKGPARFREALEHVRHSVTIEGLKLKLLR